MQLSQFTTKGRLETAGGALETTFFRSTPAAAGARSKCSAGKAAGPRWGWLTIGLLVLGQFSAAGATAWSQESSSQLPSEKLPSDQERGTVVVTPEAMEIHRRSFVFDGHNDLPWVIRTDGSRSFETLDIAKPQPQMHTDIDRLQAGGVGAQFWSVYVPANTVESGLSHQMTIEQIEIVKAMVERYPETFEFALTADDVIRIREEGKIASLIGVEGGHAIENSLEKLRRLAAMGAKYMTLTHSDSLEWADSCSDEAKCGGLNEFGRDVVQEMNRLGMLVDISHVSPETMQDAMDASEAPMIFSHSSARAVAEHVRNVPDEILRQLPDDGGVVMINFYSGFVVPESAKNTSQMFEQLREWRREFGDDKEAIKKAESSFRRSHPVLPGSVHDVADHVDHVVKIAGIDHVGIGSDYDGIGTVPAQLEDVSKYPVLTQVLLDRGYTEADIHKFMSGNILRVMREAEKVAERLQQK